MVIQCPQASRDEVMGWWISSQCPWKVLSSYHRHPHQAPHCWLSSTLWLSCRHCNPTACTCWRQLDWILLRRDQQKIHLFFKKKEKKKRKKGNVKTIRTLGNLAYIFRNPSAMHKSHACNPRTWYWRGRTVDSRLAWATNIMGSRPALAFDYLVSSNNLAVEIFYNHFII